MKRRCIVALLAVLAIIAAACGGDSEPDDSSASADPSVDGAAEPGAGTEPETQAQESPDDAGADGVADDEPSTAGMEGTRPSVNPHLADSVVPLPHGDAAQSDWSPSVGPTGPTATLTEADLTYQHLGPAHFGIAISPEYPDGRRVIWSNGGDRISKLDYDTLEVLAELPLTDQLPAADADAEIAILDATKGIDRANAGVAMATQYLLGLSGVYYILDVDNTLFVGGSTSIVAYRDIDQSDAASAIEQRDEWAIPDAVGGQFVGANITFDGRLAMVTNEGWVVLVERDFSSYEAIQLVGSESAAAHNEAMTEAGFRPGAADWVRNSLAIDEDGGIYVASVDHMHKVVWDGERLSTDPADGAWTEPYLSGLGSGSGATPALMGFGDDDRFVVITDGEEVMNVVLYWRDDIPEDWAGLPGAPSSRIAGQLPAFIGDPGRASIQTEQSVVVAGTGAFVVNNDPAASVPEGFPAAGNRVLVSYAGSDPAFSPKGMQKFEWDGERRVFEGAWVNTEVGSANAVPIVSADLRHVYTVGARDGEWTVEAIDWETGESAFHWVTGSNRYNTLYSGMNLDHEGRIVHTTAFGIVRYDPTAGAG